MLVPLIIYTKYIMNDFKYKRWVFTWNSENNGEIISQELLIQMLKNIAVTYAFQQEKMSRLHYQGFFVLSTRSRLKTILNKFESQMTLEQRHMIKNLTLERMFGTVEEALKYSTKMDTKISETIYSDDIRPYLPTDLKLFFDNSLIYPWQQEVHQYLFGTRDFLNPGEFKKADDRTILAIVDIHGNSGKSKLTKYLCYKHEKDVIKVAFGTAQQLRSAVISAGAKKVYILDIPRTLGLTDDITDIVSVVEDIKNGFVCSSMYGKYEKLMMEPPFIILFTNKPLSENLLSKDRWDRRGITLMKTLFNY